MAGGGGGEIQKYYTFKEIGLINIKFQSDIKKISIPQNFQQKSISRST